jgi:hypothetical protein
MSKHETAMTRGYWGSIGGLLKEEFCLVRPNSRCGVRLADAVILPDRETRIADRRELVDLSGQRVIVVQTKASRLGMYLMGQTLFSAELLKRYHSPASVEAVALCSRDDEVLRPLLEAHSGCHVVVMPPNQQPAILAET